MPFCAFTRWVRNGPIIGSVLVGLHSCRNTMAGANDASSARRVLSDLAFSGVALAQFGFGGFRGSYEPLPNIRYDGRFTFVRVRYDPAPGGFWPGRRPSWIHGYPLAEQNLMKIMNEVSFLGAHDE